MFLLFLRDFDFVFLFFPFQIETLYSFSFIRLYRYILIQRRCCVVVVFEGFWVGVVDFYLLLTNYYKPNFKIPMKTLYSFTGVACVLYCLLQSAQHERVQTSICCFAVTLKVCLKTNIFYIF